MNNLTEAQKEDLQLWFYSKIYVDKKSIEQAIQESAKELSIDVQSAKDYLVEDGRISDAAGVLNLVLYRVDSTDPKGIYVDIDWMGQILKTQAGLGGSELEKAFQTIYKLSPESARIEIQNLSDIEEDDE